jgi:LacI family transcriptional regulator
MVPGPRISSGHLEEGSVGRSRRSGVGSPVSSRDVAAAARVSQSTVSRVINGSSNVRPDTRARVEREMGRLGYIPNAAARSLITRRTRLLGLVVSNITNGFYPEIIDAITTCALEHGYTVVVGSAGERPESQSMYLRLLAEQRVDGVILTSTLSGDATELQRLRRAGLPIVLANRVRDDLPLDGVSLDNAGAGAAAARHLIELGRRAIAYVGGRAQTATDQGRRAGFERALAAAGLEPVPVTSHGGAFTREHGYEATRQLLLAGDGSRPDAIVAADDTVALGCLDALAEADVAVPAEVAVVGFDDIPAASLRSVWLTTVSTAARAMGTRAVELVIERIRSGPGPEPVRELLPARLIVRGTCGHHVPEPPAPALQLQARPGPPGRRRTTPVAAPTGGRS